MSLSKELKEAWHSHLIANSAVAITTSIIALLFWGFPNIFEKVSDAILRMFSSKELLTIILLLLLLCSMLIAYLLSYKNKIKSLEELTPKNGIYEDKKGNAYCVAHKHLMSFRGKNTYYCTPCKQYYSCETNNMNINDGFLKPTSIFPPKT